MDKQMGQITAPLSWRHGVKPVRYSANNGRQPHNGAVDLCDNQLHTASVSDLYKSVVVGGKGGGVQA